jgi:hypothetical protein
MDRARATLGYAAGILRAYQAQMVPEHPKEWGIVIYLNLMVGAVDSKFKVSHCEKNIDLSLNLGKLNGVSNSFDLKNDAFFTKSDLSI